MIFDANLMLLHGILISSSTALCGRLLGMGDLATVYPEQAANSIAVASQLATPHDNRPPFTEAEKLIKRILVPTVFSPACEKAVARAVVLANQCEASVTILHVVDVNAQADAENAHELMERLWNQASAAIGRLAWSLRGQMQVQTILEEGLAWDAIVEKSREFDLLILGVCRKRHGLFSQHTFERVIERANCPVMVIHE